MKKFHMSLRSCSRSCTQTHKWIQMGQTNRPSFSNYSSNFDNDSIEDSWSDSSRYALSWNPPIETLKSLGHPHMSPTVSGCLTANYINPALNISSLVPHKTTQPKSHQKTAHPTVQTQDLSCSISWIPLQSGGVRALMEGRPEDGRSNIYLGQRAVETASTPTW